MFTARAELLDKGETTMEHTKNRQEEAGKLDQDKSNNHPTQGGLFGGLFRPKAPPLKPVIDIDDGVMRCPYCSWELEEGEHCAGCGYRYRPGSETDETESSDESESGSDLDSLDDMDDEEPEEPEDDFGDVDDNDGVWGEFASRYPTNGPTFGMPPLPGFMGSYQTMARLGYHGSAMPPELVSRFTGNYGQDEFDFEEDIEDENEYDHEDSFINDGTQLMSGDYESDSDHSTVVSSSQPNGPPRPNVSRHQTPPHIVSDTDGEDDSEEDSEEESDSDSSDEDDIRAAPPRQAFGNAPRPVWREPGTSPWPQRIEDLPPSSAETVESSEASEDSEAASSSPPRPPATSRPSTGRGLSARNAIALDDSDDDQPVGPVRRNTHRRRNRYSPY